MTATLTPAVQELCSRFANLSPKEQAVFREQLGSPDSETDDLGIPSWHWEVLQEREELAARGLDQPIPWAEAKIELRKKWGAK